MSDPEDTDTIPKQRSFLPPPKVHRIVKDASEKEDCQTPKAESRGSTQLKLGDLVTISGVKKGVLRYFGSTEFASGEWCGVELYEPDGKHAGTVNGVSYFSCPSLHGIFAPLQKVEITIPEDVFSECTYPTSKERSSSPEKNRVRHARHSHSGLPTPSKRPKTSSDSETSVTSEQEDTRVKSKLVRPKLIAKPIDQSYLQDGYTSTSSRDSSLGRGTKDVISPERVLPLPRVGKGRSRAIPRPNARNGKKKETTATKQKSLEDVEGLTSVDITKDGGNDSEDDSDHNKDDIDPTRVDSHTAHTLTYCMESSGSDVELPRQQSRDVSVAEIKSFSSISSVPDLLKSPVVYTKHPLDTDMSLPEEDITQSTVENLNLEPDPTVGLDLDLGELTDENLYGDSLLSGEITNEPSSLAILSENELAKHSLVTDEFIAAFARHKEALLGRETIELPEKEIDREISGISTPEMEVSSGKDPTSSPEPELIKPEDDLNITFEINSCQASTPLEGASKTGSEGGEKMASPTVDPSTFLYAKQDDLTYNLSCVDKRRSWPMSASSNRLIEPMDVDGSQTSVKMREKTYTLISGGSLEEYPKRMRTSADLDNIDVMSTSASFELTKTAVAQYADLVQGAAKEKLLAKETDLPKSASDHDNCNVTYEVNKTSHCDKSDQILGGGDATHTLSVLSQYAPVMESSDDCSSDGMGNSIECVQIEDAPAKILTRSLLAVDLGEQITDTDENMTEVILSSEKALCEAELDAEGNTKSSPSDEGTLTGQQQDEELISTELDEQDQLIADLQKGHHKSERPTSMVSTSSADTGIVADLNPRSRAERPISLISTSSVDTGYQAETDGEHGASPTVDTAYLAPCTSSTFSAQTASSQLSQHNEGDKVVDVSAAACPPASNHRTHPARTATATLLPLLESQRHLIHMDETDSVGEWLKNSKLHDKSDNNNGNKDEEEMDDSSDESNTEEVLESDSRGLGAAFDELLDSDHPMEFDDPVLDTSTEDATMTEMTGVDVIEESATGGLNVTVVTSRQEGDQCDTGQDETAGMAGSSAPTRQIDIMSESTEKDAGSEIQSKDNDKPTTPSKGAGGKASVEKTTKKSGVTLSKVKSKLTLKAKTAEKKSNVSEKDKQVKKTTSKVLDKKVKEAVSSIKLPPSKADQQTTSKPPPKKAKSATSKLSEYFKRPLSSKPKDENDTVKAKKDMSNTGKKKTEISKIMEPEKKTVARKLDLGSHQRTLTVAPVVQDDGNGQPPKRPAKRERPKSKWENIMSQIDVGKQSKAGKGGGETSKAKDSVSAPAAKNPRSSSLPVSHEPSRITRRNITKEPSKPGGASGSRSSSAALVVPRTRSSTSPAPSGSRPSSLVGSASDMALLDLTLQTSKTSSTASGRTSSIRAPSPKVVGKPANKAMSALKKRERSESIGSESQSSVSSQVSSTQGSRASPAPSRPAAKRKSLTESSSPGKLTASDTDSSKANSGAATPNKLTATKLKRPTSAATGLKKPSTSTNQNRNKTTKTSSVAVKGSSGAQPDVVAASVGRVEAARQEVTRLGALCEARTKQLNTARWQLQRQAAGFDAMAVLIRYLTEELDAFSCPELKLSLDDTRQQLARAGEQLVELTKQRDALIAEIQCLQESHLNHVQKLKKESDDVAKNLNHQIQQQIKHQEKKDAEHIERVNSLKHQHEQKTKEQQTKQQNQLSDQQDEHLKQLKETEKDNDRRTDDLQKHHQLQLEEMTLRFEEIKLTLSEKVEVLRSECEEMRQRERTYQEACRRDGALQVQRALAPYHHLPQEIDSLKAVLELKNEEIKQLRAHKLQLEQQLEVLPQKEAAIKKLEQKVENLEAIVDLKTDSERHLSDRHQILLRKFDKESKQNKRISMDYEELVWRVQNESASPDILQRSISHSPPNSGASTPEPFRRRQTPISPRSPRTLEPDMAHQGAHGVTLRHPRTASVNLRRSGTYDLLDHEYEDEKQLKRENGLKH